MSKNKEEIKEFIRKSYGEIALKGSQGCGCGCGCGCNTEQRELSPLDIKGLSLNIGYSENDLNDMPRDANMGLGCGNPVAIANLKKGETVVDLGSGGGFDCFLARRQVGENGYVIGVDMTAEMVQLSRKNAEKMGFSNVEFRLGEIEHLPIADETADVIISNCVINLSLHKENVFKEAYRVLKHGGRLSISDIVATAELPERIKQDLTMMAGCISGAEYAGNIKRMLEDAGFTNISMSPKDNSREVLRAWAPDRNIEDFVASFIIEAQKA